MKNEEMLAWIELEMIRLKDLQKQRVLKESLIEELEALISKGIEKFGKEYAIMSGAQMSEFMHSIEDDGISKEHYEKIKDFAPDGKIITISPEESKVIKEQSKDIIRLVNEDFKLVDSILIQGPLSSEEKFEEMLEEMLEGPLRDRITKRFVELSSNPGSFDLYMKILQVCVIKGSPFTEEEIEDMEIIGKIEA